MIDIKLIRENPETIRENLKKRCIDDTNFNKLLEIDNEWRKVKKYIDELRSKRNKISEEINSMKKNGKSIDNLIKEAKNIPEQINKQNETLNSLEIERDKIWKVLPNLIDKSVPAGDASHNKVLKSFGKRKKGKKGHEEIMTSLNLVDIKKAAEVSGTRFYYLKGNLVRLNHAIIDYALDFLKKKKFMLIQPPYMLRKEVLEGALTFDAFEESIYKIEGEDLYLIGTAEHALNALYFNETINGKDLPIKLAGISPCFRKEAGAHGKDMKGIFRVHQFDKIEQFVFCKPEDSWKIFGEILNNTIELFKGLEIPFRTVMLSAGDTGRVPAKTMDIEGWFPSQNTYRELSSCSNCLDYQARRSNTRFQDKKGLRFVHTLNNTAISVTRMLTCFVENHIQADGSIKIPKALWKYTGFKVIKKN